MKKENTFASMHQQARQLIDQELVEGLAAEEGRWLADHLAACGECAGWAAETKQALQTLQPHAVTVPPGLAASTTLRVRAKADELRQQRARVLALGAACALSWMAGVASAPLVWKLCAWLGGALDLPPIVWELGFVGWWFVPTAVAALVMVWEQARSDSGLSVPDSRWPGSP
jgi:hypothetical protein